MSNAFNATDPASNEGITNTWFTPRHIIDSLGEFDLDPCTQSYRPFDTAKDHICEDEGRNGLIEHWYGRIWLNPPYGKHTNHWLNRLAEHGDGIALLFNRTDTAWFHGIISTASAVCFIQSRLTFIKGDGSLSSNAGCGSILIAFGESNIKSLKNINGSIMRYQP